MAGRHSRHQGSHSCLLPVDFFTALQLLVTLAGWCRALTPGKGIAGTHDTSDACKCTSPTLCVTIHLQNVVTIAALILQAAQDTNGVLPSSPSLQVTQKPLDASLALPAEEASLQAQSDTVGSQVGTLVCVQSLLLVTLPELWCAQNSP